jgi:hypothetical protein
MLFKQEFHYSEVFQMFLHCFQDWRFQSPCQPSGRCVIPFGRPSVHCSIHPRTTCLIVRMPDRPSIIRSDDVHFPFGPLLYWETTILALHPSGRLNSPSGRLLVIDQLQILSKFNLREDFFNRSDDVDSRPDALIHKARIAIQISLFGRQSALVRTRVQQLRKLPIRLQPSGQLTAYHGPDARIAEMEIVCLSSAVRTLIPYGSDARSLIWKLLAADVRPSGRLCLTVLTRLSNMIDFQRKSQKILSHCCPSGRPRYTIRTASVHIIAVAHSAPQPINRDPWALRTARIWYWIPQVLREVILKIVELI